MKRASEILNRVKQTPYLKSVQKYSCYNKLLELMPPRFAKAIAFFYIKNNILFGALSHPGYKMELNYNKDLVKGLLNQIASFDLECKEIFKEVQEIKFFVSKFHTPAPLVLSSSIPRYQELAKGEFKILAQDPDIKTLFEKIKEDIINNYEKN